MNHRRKAGLVLVLVLLLLATVALVQAQAGGGYDLAWNTVDGGGGTFSTGAGYALGGTAGQPDAGVLTGGGYSLGGGFWKGGLPSAAYRIHLPLVLRNH